MGVPPGHAGDRMVRACSRVCAERAQHQAAEQLAALEVTHKQGLEAARKVGVLRTRACNSRVVQPKICGLV